MVRRETKAPQAPEAAGPIGEEEDGNGGVKSPYDAYFRRDAAPPGFDSFEGRDDDPAVRNFRNEDTDVEYDGDRSERSDISGSEEGDFTDDDGMGGMASPRGGGYGGGGGGGGHHHHHHYQYHGGGRVTPSSHSRGGGGGGGGRRRTRSGGASNHSRFDDMDLEPIDTDTVQFRDLDEDENVHKMSIQKYAMKSPAVSEMNENEMFAKAVGLRYSRNNNMDVISVGGGSGSLPQDDDDMDDPDLSPRHRGQNKRGVIGDIFNNLGFRSYDEDDAHADDADSYRDEHGNALPPNATFLRRTGDDNDDEADLAQLRLLAGHLSTDWKTKEFFAPALARRLRDFQFAQEKRRKKYGNERPWGILGLYDHLAAVRMDVEWAEDAAWRRANGEPYCPWAEFEASKNSGFNRPFFTYFILVACTAVLITSIGLNEWVVEPIDVNPMIGPSAETLVKMGAKQTNLIVNGNESWRLVTPMALHAGLIHYFLNMLALWFIGSAVEQSHGFIPALILFIIPAIGGTVLSAIFLPEYISVGASGGIFGLIGACLADIVMNWSLLFSDFVNQGANKKRHIMVLVFLFLDIVVNALLGLTPFVDNFTHLGGMVFGFLCGLSTMERIASDFFGVEERRCWSITKNIIARFFGIIISIVSIMAATIVLLEGDGVTSPCHTCNTLSCVPFPPWSEKDDKWWYCDDCGDVTADAKIDPTTGAFNQLDLKCPDGQRATFDLDVPQTDKAWLEGHLPKFCRQHCEKTHSN